MSTPQISSSPRLSRAERTQRTSRNTSESPSPRDEKGNRLPCRKETVELYPGCTETIYYVSHEVTQKLKELGACGGGGPVGPAQ